MALAKHCYDSTEGKAIFYRHLSSAGEIFAFGREPTRQGVDVESAMRNNKCPIFFSTLQLLSSRIQSSLSLDARECNIRTLFNLILCVDDAHV